MPDTLARVARYDVGGWVLQKREVALREMLVCPLQSWPDVPHTRAQGIDFRLREWRPYMQDDVLIERVSLGDHDAFAALYDRHSALVYGIARRMLGEGAAADVAQSVFLRIWMRPHAFRGGSFGAWVARVTRNACLDILRSSAVRLREPELPEDVVAQVETDEEVFAQVRAEAVVGALDQLSLEQRAAIEKAYFEGLSYREAAEMLGEPVGTVKSRIRGGLRRLWEALHEKVPR